MKRLLLILCALFILTGCGVSQEEYLALQEKNKKLQEEIETLNKQVIQKENTIIELSEKFRQVIYADKTGGYSSEIEGWEESLSNVVYAGHDLSILYTPNEELDQRFVGVYKSTNYERHFFLVVYPSGTVVVAYNFEDKIEFEDGKYHEGYISIGVGSPGISFADLTLTNSGFEASYCTVGICAIPEDVVTLKFKRIS